MSVRKWTLFMTGEQNGLVGHYGCEFKGHPEHYPRVAVVAEEDHARVVEALRALRDQCDMNLDDVPSSVDQELRAADHLLAQLEADHAQE